MGIVDEGLSESLLVGLEVGEEEVEVALPLYGD